MGANGIKGMVAAPKGEILRPLSAEDLSILALEDETVAGHTCKVIVLGERIDPVRLRAAIAGRLVRAPQLRMRLAQDGGKPCWVTDQQPDLERHVVACECGEAPLDAAALRAEITRLFEQRLDRTRPLWQIDVIPELAGAGSALVWRIHHALADGMTTMKIAGAAMWDDAESLDANVLPAAAAKGSAPTSFAHQRLGGVRAAVREAPRPWQRSPLDGPISSRRAVAFLSIELGALRRVARAAKGATVNDAILSIVAGGLRGWLEHHHGRLDSLRVKVPVSLHGAQASATDGADPGNRDSFFCLDLPLGSADPLERLRAIHHATKLRKHGHDAEQLDTLMRQLGRVPRLRQFAETVMAHPRSFALNVSNVPGPRRPVHVLGSRVLAIYPLAEIREHHMLRIAVTSVGDALDFGLVADPTLLGDVERLATLIRAEADQLVSRLRAV